MRLEPCLKPELTLVLEGCPGLDAALESLADLGTSWPGLPAKEELIQGLKDREERYPTSTPEGVAFPHVLVKGVEQTLIVPALLKPGVKWKNPAHPAQDLVFGMFGNIDRPWEHVRLLARLARIVRTPGALDRLRAATDAPGLHEALLIEDRSHG